MDPYRLRSAERSPGGAQEPTSWLSLAAEPGGGIERGT
jgi:hypothetical protein